MNLFDRSRPPSSSGAVTHLAGAGASSRLNILRVTDRREIVNHYLDLERRSGRRVPTDWSNLPYEDPNVMDRWLKGHGLKHGVISGFRQWAYTALQWHNLLECAVVEKLSRGVSVRSLGGLHQIG